MSRIELKQVGYRYPLSETDVLADLSCSFEEGRLYGIIGANSSGKTTLCNLVRGLIPHFFNGELRGEALIDGTDVRDWNAGELSRLIGYIFQNPFTQMSGIKKTVFEEVGFGLENLGFEKERMIDRILEILQLLGLEEFAEKDPNALSGGQRQRVAFASVLAMDSEILVIDEPTSQLDPESTRQIFSIIRTLKDQGKTILLVEHKINLLAEFADEILVLDGGRLAAAGPAAAVLGDVGLLERGADVPQTARLGAELAAAGIAGARPWTTNREARAAIESWGLSW